jgi:histidine phosphotransferase ChpT
MTSDTPAPDQAPDRPAAPVVTPVEFATRLAARLCHDFASPMTAIASGLDLIGDPTAQDMREEAMDLLAVGGKKLGAILSFSRIAFAGAGAAESYDARELEGLAQAIYGHARANLEWAVAPGAVAKVPAQVLLNLAQLGSAVLPMGGTARLEAVDGDEGTTITLTALGARARLRPEAAQGLRGEAMTEGLGGHWVQGYFLHSLVAGAGGVLSFEVEDERVAARAVLPTR